MVTEWMGLIAERSLLLLLVGCSGTRSFIRVHQRNVTTIQQYSWVRAENASFSTLKILDLSDSRSENRATGDPAEKAMR
jgi:hypothetical protein